MDPIYVYPAQKAQYILDENSSDPFVKWTYKALGEVHRYLPDMDRVRQVYDSHMMNELSEMGEAHERGEVQWPHTYAFMPDELKGIMEDCGAVNVLLSGPGALSRSIPGEVLRNIMNGVSLCKDFLDFCYEYDSNPWCAGMGKDNLVACAVV